MTVAASNPREEEQREDALRLQHCPQCNYSLRGLPRAGACPECGVPYPDCLAIRPSQPSILLYSTIAASCVVALVVGLNLWFVFGVARPGCMLLVLPLVFGAMAAQRLVAALRMKRSKRELGTLLLTEDGVLRIGHASIERRPWRSVQSFRISPAAIRWPGSRRGAAADWVLSLAAWRHDDGSFRADAPLDVLRGGIDAVRMRVRLTDSEVATVCAMFRRHGVYR